MPSASKPSWPPFPVAIVGMACRLPGAADIAQFWDLLRSGRDAVGEVPRDRWDVDWYYHPDPARPGRIYTKAGGFLDSIDRFDADFFGISPREARQMDPQQRILLELAWEALEHADIVPARLAGSDTGVFIGISNEDYGILQRNAAESITDPYGASGSALAVAANRISYILDLHGPSLAIDTACSSALVAVHGACHSLWRGESSLAIAGGVNILLAPETHGAFCKAAMLSPTGRCRAFAAEADGYVRSEGGGVVILKPLSAALADGNTIRAVILGAGVNSDGRTKGIALPNPVAQEQLLRQVYGTAGIDPADVSYVEAHGTGTSAGDRVECTALGRVFGATRRADDPCLIGSVKTNIGHLEPASGIAGLLKATLALEHGAIPPSLHAGNLNPKIPFDELNLSVVRELRSLPERGAPPMIGVNSFGFGGTNAHLVLRGYAPAAPAPAAPQTDDSIEMLVLSARSEGALKALAERYAKRLREPDAPALATVCRAVATRRSHHPMRIATFGESREEVAGRLEAFAAGYPAQMLAEGEASYQPSRIAFVFSGNGSQWVGMSRDLLAREPDFAACVARIDTALKPLVGWSVLEMLQGQAPSTLFDKTEIAQPALFALQVGLVDLLRRRGLAAEAVLGHSVGEVAAAHAAGALTLEQACLVVARRSQAQGNTAGAGKMAAVGLTEEQAIEAIAPYGDALEISAVNSPASVTVSGEASALGELAEALEAKGVFVRILGLDYAFHSKAMAPLRDEVMAAFAGLKPTAGECRFISTVTGAERDGASLDADYWWNNIRQPVRFGQAVKRLAEDGIDVFLEIGPHPVLAGYLRECLQGADRTILGTLRRSEPEREALWLALARCHAAGVNLDFKALFPGEIAPVALPAYPWQRERYWFESSERMALPKLSKRLHPLLGYRAPTADADWQNSVDAATPSFLRDHVVGGGVVFPAAGYIEMALAAAVAHVGADVVEIEGLEIHRPLVLGDKASQWLEFIVAEDNSFRIVNQQKLGPAAPPLAVGRFAALAEASRPSAAGLETLRASLPLRVGAEDHLARCAAHGLAYGPAFQGLRELWASEGEALGRIEAPAVIAAELGAYHMHPAVLDACLQTAAGALQMAERAGDRSSLIPVRIERFRSFGSGDRIAWSHARVVRADRSGVVVDFTLLDGEGTAIAEIEGLRLRRVELTRASEIPTYHWDAEVQLQRGAAGGSADLPGPIDCASALAPEVARLTRALGIERGRETLEPALDRLAAAYAARALRALGASETPFTVPGLVQQARLAPEGEPYLGALLAMLDRHGAALRSGAEWRLRGDAAGEDPSALWRRLVADHPDHLASLELVARCGERLEALLRGEADAESLLFSERDFNAGEQFEDSDPMLRFGNEIAAGVMRHLRTHVAAGRALRVLEVGGGSGGLAAALLPELPAERVEYVFTDPRESALARAEGRFTDYPFMRYARLDLDQDLAGQGVALAEFDVIVAANALHECTDLSRSLARLRELLRPGGLLLLVEPRPSDFLEFVFGIRRRWWSFADLDLRAETPLMPPAQWEAALKAAAFTETAVLPRDSTAVAVVLARAPAGNGHAQAEPATEPRTFILITGGADPDRGGPVALIGRRLVALGHRLLTVSEAPAFERINGTFRAPLDAADGHGHLARALKEATEGPLEIIYLRGLRDNPGADPLLAQERGSLGLLRLCQALVETGISGGSRIWVATSGAVSSPVRPGLRDPAQASLWGVARVLRNERPDMSIRLVDIDPADGPDVVTAVLVGEILHPSEEDEVILRGTARHVRRLRRGPPPAALPAGWTPSGYRLELAQNSHQDGLVLKPMAVPRAGAGEVTVRVRAGGLNFRDVLQRIGLLPEEAFEGGYAGATLGMEFAGEVLEVGSGVSAWKPGDAVFGFAPGALRSHLLLPADGLFPKPAAVSFEAAATLPVAMLTAYYSLHHMARLQRGERVLIHGAAGGVGLAAIQYAQWAGAEIFASAGTPAKRDFLRRLGVRHIVDSRSLGFADEVRRLTNGEGVDVVLNSLAGEALHKGVGLLRPYGRFIELGKRDFWANTKLGLQPFRNNIQFCGVDVDRLLVDRPVLAATLLRELAGFIAEGVFRPLPQRAFPVARAAEAFRHLQHSRHIGKVVLTFDGAPALVPETPAGDFAVVPEATYLVTGGRGGFGLATAEWLAAKGARHLVLVGRSAETKPEAAAAIERLRERGVVVREAALDVADGAALADLVEMVKQEMPPLRGIVHCAAVIDDAALANLTAERFLAVMRPKVLGAWHLDRLSRDLPLDFFVVYSSAATLLGNLGQANYVAANLYLEALIEQRRAAGLPGLAMLWGAIGGVGHLARHADVAKTMTERLGVKLLAPAEGLERMGQAIVAGVGHLAVADLDWSKLMSLPQLAKAPKFSAVRPDVSAAAGEASRSADELRALLASMPAGQRFPYVQQLVVKQIATVLRVPPSKLHPNQALLDLGIDSLMVVELQLGFEQQFGISVSPVELMEITSIGQLVRHVASKLGIESGVPGGDSAAPGNAVVIDTPPSDVLDGVGSQVLAQDRGGATAVRVS